MKYSEEIKKFVEDSEKIVRDKEASPDGLDEDTKILIEALSELARVTK